MSIEDMLAQNHTSMPSGSLLLPLDPSRSYTSRAAASSKWRMRRTLQSTAP